MVRVKPTRTNSCLLNYYRTVTKKRNVFDVPLQCGKLSTVSAEPVIFGVTVKTLLANKSDGPFIYTVS